MNQAEYTAFLEAAAEAFSDQYKFSPRERQVFRQIVLFPTRDAPAIAAQLNVEPGTIRTYMSDIFKKTKTNSRENVVLKFFHAMTQEKPLPPLRVVAIDDNAELLERIGNAVENVFQTKDHFRTVSGAVLIESLLEEWRQTESLPDLLLLDLYMPGLDGFEVIKKIRTDPKLCATRIVVFSSTGDLEDARRATMLGANSFVSKNAETMEVGSLQKLLRKVFQYWSEIAKPSA